MERKFQASQQIVALEIRKLEQNVLDRVALRQVLQHRIHRMAQIANARFPAADVRIDGDTASQSAHRALYRLKRVKTSQRPALAFFDACLKTLEDINV